MGAQKATALVLLAAAALVAMVTTAAAQNSPQDFLDLHNAARRNEGVGLADVVWDTTLEAFAQNYAAVRASDCSLTHSNSQSFGYGENLFMGGAGKDWAAVDAVDLWMNEKNYYDYASNTCSAGQYGCLHYTQIVWRDTTSIGCAHVVCSNGGIFINCNYYPAGNVNLQRPY